MKEVQGPDIEGAAGQVDSAGGLGNYSHAKLYYTLRGIEIHPGFLEEEDHWPIGFNRIGRSQIKLFTIFGR
jgi:hypothetical protein